MTNKVNGELESVEILTKLVAIYKAALEAAKRKQAVLGSGTIADLKETLRTEETLAESIRKLERERLALQEHYGWPGSIRQLVALLPEEHQSRAAELADELSGTVRALALQNSINSEIITHLQNFISNNLDLIHNMQSGPAYNPGGEVSPLPTGGRSIVDRKI